MPKHNCKIAKPNDQSADSKASHKLVDVDNSISFYEKLRHLNVPAEMHLYPKGGHGFLLRQPAEQWAHGIVPQLAQPENWGLDDQPLEERLLCRAGWATAGSTAAV